MTRSSPAWRTLPGRRPPRHAAEPDLLRRGGAASVHVHEEAWGQDGQPLPARGDRLPADHRRTAPQGRRGGGVALRQATPSSTTCTRRVRACCIVQRSGRHPGLPLRPVPRGLARAVAQPTTVTEGLRRAVLLPPRTHAPVRSVGTRCPETRSTTPTTCGRDGRARTASPGVQQRRS